MSTDAAHAAAIPTEAEVAPNVTEAEVTSNAAVAIPTDAEVTSNAVAAIPNETEVIDLTSPASKAGTTAAGSSAATTIAAAGVGATTAAANCNITPDRPVKRQRTSRRLEALREQQQREEDAGKHLRKVGRKVNEHEEEGRGDDDDTPEYDGNHTNGYFEVDEILDRRTRKYGSEGAGLRHVVEYLVSWKKPADYDGDESYYDPSWLIAENLDQNSLASAFRQFPADADPDRGAEDVEPKVAREEDQEHFLSIEDELSDDEESEEDEEEEEYADKSSEDMHELDDEEDGAKAEKVAKDPDVSRLEDSDYDSPGTVELVLNRRTYRVGQSFYAGPEEGVVYTISMIQPIPRKAKCLKYMRMDKCFVCPKGRENCFVLLGEEVTLDLSLLRIPCKVAFERFPMRYEQEDESQRSFAYFAATGRVLHHPTGRPACLELFSGAGGMSLGLEKYFDVRWVVDSDQLAAATLRANKVNGSDIHIYTEDVKTFLKRSVRGDPCYPSIGQVDHVHASPPCKGFSRANRSGGKNDALNNKQTLLFVKAIKHFRPKTVTFENVPGLVLEDYKGYLQSVVANLLQMSYQVRVKVLTSSSYGDPQKRRRLILMASRGDCLLPTMPAPTHGPGLLPTKTCKDALQVLDGHEPTRSKSSGAVLVDGTTIFNHVIPGFKREMDTDYELIEDEPSRTIMAGGRPYRHYGGDRLISVREAACLQSFPMTYRFFGGLTSQYSQVGNAVPVKLATAIARNVAVVHGCAV